MQKYWRTRKCIWIPFSVSQVFEVFGPVSRPLYILRLNSSDDLSSQALTLGQIVYYAPDMKEYTEYVLLQQLQRWLHRLTSVWRIVFPLLIQCTVILLCYFISFFPCSLKGSDASWKNDQEPPVEVHSAAWIFAYVKRPVLNQIVKTCWMSKIVVVIQTDISIRTAGQLCSIVSFF